MNRKQRFKCARLNTLIIRYHKKCCCMKTPGQWPWKLESAKECVTTHLANAIALKINGAESVSEHINGHCLEAKTFKRQCVSLCDVCENKITKIDKKKTESDLVSIIH